MKALGVVVVLEALFLGLILALYLSRESAPTTFPAVVAVQAPAASVDVGSRSASRRRSWAGRSTSCSTSRGGNATAVQP